MSIATETSRVTYTGNNSTVTPYAVTFPFFDASDLVVTVTDDEGVETVLTITTDYAVTGGSGGQGSIVTEDAIAVTSTVTIERTLPLTQSITFPEGQRFPSSILTRGLDRVVAMVQQVLRRIDDWYEEPINDATQDALDEKVAGPASVTTDRVALFDGTTGKLIKQATQTIANLLARANHTGTQLASTISDFSAAAVAAVTWSTITGKPSTFAPTIGSGADEAVAGNDARLTDDRDPNAHAASHQNGGSDEIATATPAANAIPKADGSGDLADGWLSANVPLKNAPNSFSSNQTITAARGALQVVQYHPQQPASAIFRNTGSVETHVYTDTVANGSKTIIFNSANNSVNIDTSGGLEIDGVAVTSAATGSAAGLTSGTLADARLSSNVPLLNADNEFAGTNGFGHVEIKGLTGARGLRFLEDSITSTLSARLFFENGTVNQGVSIYNSAGSILFNTGATPLSTSGTNRVEINATNTTIKNNAVVTGDTTLGDAAGDTTTINSSAPTAPNLSTMASATTLANRQSGDARWVQIPTVLNSTGTQSFDGTAYQTVAGCSLAMVAYQGAHFRGYAYIRQLASGAGFKIRLNSSVATGSNGTAPQFIGAWGVMTRADTGAVVAEGNMETGLVWAGSGTVAVNVTWLARFFARNNTPTVALQVAANSDQSGNDIQIWASEAAMTTDARP